MFLPSRNVLAPEKTSQKAILIILKSSYRFFDCTLLQVIPEFDLAQYFLTERGNTDGNEVKHFYDWEK
jgi:hypothetical protein